MGSDLLALAAKYFPHLGYLIVVFCGLIEGLSLPIPTILLMLMVGAASASGRFSPVMVVAIYSITYTIGATALYYIGKNLSQYKNVGWATGIIERSQTYLDKVNELFGKHGEKIVALARPFWIGNAISFVAGMVGMPLIRFIVFTLIGITPWAIAVVTIGYYFSANLAKASETMKDFSALLMLSIASFIIGRLVYKSVKKKWLQPKESKL